MKLCGSEALEKYSYALSESESSVIGELYPSCFVSENDENQDPLYKGAVFVHNMEYLLEKESNIYFRNIKSILLKIKYDIKLSAYDRFYYVSMFLLNVGNKQLCVMAIYALRYRDKDFINIIEYFHLLRNFPYSKSELYKLLQKEYAPEAFHDSGAPDYPTT